MNDQMRILPPKKRKEEQKVERIEETIPQPTPPQAVAAHSFPSIPMVLGMLLLVGIFGAFTLRRRGDTVEHSSITPPSLPATAVTLVIVATPTPAPATATPDPCTSAKSNLQLITDQEQHNKWDVAAENAESSLNNSTLCTEYRRIFAKKYMTDSLEGLYARIFEKSKAGQLDAAEQYQTLRRNSQRYRGEFPDLDIPDSLGIAHRAVETGKFLLAKVAYDEAWEQGSFTAADQRLITDYASNLYNIGAWWTNDQHGLDYKEGLTYLSASWHVAVKYRTGQAEAWGRLKELFGPDERKWPDPAPTPLLP